MPNSTNNPPSGTSGGTNNTSNTTTTTAPSNTPSSSSSNTNTNPHPPGTLKSLIHKIRTSHPSSSPLTTTQTNEATAWYEAQFRLAAPMIDQGGMYFCQYFDPSSEDNGELAGAAQFVGPDVIATRLPSGEVFTYDPYTDFGEEDFARYQELYGFLLENFRAYGEDPTPSDSPGPWHFGRVDKGVVKGDVSGGGNGSGGSGNGSRSGGL